MRSSENVNEKVKNSAYQSWNNSSQNDAESRYPDAAFAFGPFYHLECAVFTDIRMPCHSLPLT